MPKISRLMPLVFLFSAFLFSSCAMVKVKSIDAQKFITMSRDDVLTSGDISQVTADEIHKSNQTVKTCKRKINDCIRLLEKDPEILTQKKLSALAELWLYKALNTRLEKDEEEKNLAFLQSAKYAYAYLFPGARYQNENRRFEYRHTQVKDYYTFSLQTVMSNLFKKEEYRRKSLITLGPWKIKINTDNLSLTDKEFLYLIPVSSLTFKGFMSHSQKDGFGAEFVGELPRLDINKSQSPFSQMNTPAITAVLNFTGENYREIIAATEGELILYDPYKQSNITIHGQKIPLAADFTASYGLWLATSDFAWQSLQTLLGVSSGIDKAHIFLMQPYDPDKRIIFMVHGLASSPEAWVNLANELVGDDNIRDDFQLWSVYYPTNAPILSNLIAIKNVFNETLTYFDPEKKNKASKNAVLIGHSMGGVIARLMVSDSENEFLPFLNKLYGLNPQTLPLSYREQLNITPMPEFKRVIFLATPHRGTEVADQTLGRLISKLVRVPFSVFFNTGMIFGDIVNTLAHKNHQGPHQLGKVNDDFILPNSIDNLKEDDPFIKKTATFPIASDVIYHSIIANRYKDHRPLAETSDGLVPYWSSHLKGAASEKIIHSGHSVQENPAAISEIIRILYVDMGEHHEIKKTNF